MKQHDARIGLNFIDKYLRKTIVKKSYNPDTGSMTDQEYPVIVDDGKLPGNHPMMKSSQSDTALLLRGIPGSDSSEQYWLEYGRRVADSFSADKPIGIRCDSCTALAFYLLRQNGCRASITVIEQAKGNANGHWFLLVGCDNQETITYQGGFPRGSFVVDLWGVGVQMQRNTGKYRNSVIDPALCIYDCNDNKLTRKVYSKGETTVPTKKSFIRSTTISGCLFNKSRGKSLKALDKKLDDYHCNRASLHDLAQAFNYWVRDKRTRQGAQIDSIRNAQGQMNALRRNIRWLGDKSV